MMGFNPMTFATTEQKQKLIMMQGLTKKIRYTVHTEDKENRVEVTLKTDDPEATQLIPQLMEGIVDSVTQMLYTMFAMEGERV